MDNQSLANLSGLARRRSTQRLLLLQRVLDLDSFFAGLGDLTDGSYLDLAVRWRDVGPFIAEWRRQVDSIRHDAVAIGDGQVTALASELNDRREDIARVMETPSRDHGPAPMPPAIPERLTQRPIHAITAELIERLQVLIRRARKTEVAVVVALAAAVVGLAVVAAVASLS